MTLYNFGHKFIPMPQAMKIPDAKAALDKEWKKMHTLPAWQLEKVKSKKEGIREAQRNKESPLCYIDGHMSLQKNAELDKTSEVIWSNRIPRRHCQRRLRTHAVFTEQGSSASQMTAAKVMDVVARLPGCDGQAADAVSAYTQVKLEDAPRLLKIPKSKCPDVWTRLPRHKWPKIMRKLKIPCYKNSASLRSR